MHPASRSNSAPQNGVQNRITGLSEQELMPVISFLLQLILTQPYLRWPPLQVHSACGVGPFHKMGASGRNLVPIEGESRSHGIRAIDLGNVGLCQPRSHLNHRTRHCLDGFCRRTFLRKRYTQTYSSLHLPWSMFEVRLMFCKWHHNFLGQLDANFVYTSEQRQAQEFIKDQLVFLQQALFTERKLQNLNSLREQNN